MSTEQTKDVSESKIANTEAGLFNEEELFSRLPFGQVAHLCC
jgi:hypothetical protein